LFIGCDTGNGTETKIPSENVKIYGSVKVVSEQGGAWNAGMPLAVQLSKEYISGNNPDVEERQLELESEGTASWEFTLKRADIKKYSGFRLIYNESIRHNDVCSFTISDDQEEINFGNRTYLSYIQGTIKKNGNPVSGCSLLFSKVSGDTVKVAYNTSNGLNICQGSSWLNGENGGFFWGALELESDTVPPRVYFILADWDNDTYTIFPPISITSTSDEGGGTYGSVGDLECNNWLPIEGW
jgi:hypothetical protein